LEIGAHYDPPNSYRCSEKRIPAIAGDHEFGDFLFCFRVDNKMELNAKQKRDGIKETKHSKK
jgi:hypothetical protein